MAQREISRLWSPRVRLLVLLALCVLAAASTAAGLHSATVRSEDFQWSPAKILADGRDPYRAYLRGSHEIILAQQPNYQELLYFVLVPLGALSFRVARVIWALINVAMAVGSVLLVGRHLKLARGPQIALLDVFLISTPVRNVIGNGQDSLLVLFMAILAYTWARATPAGAALALALAKYSFAPLALIALVRRRERSVAVAALVLLAATGAFALLVGAGFGTAAREPFRVSRVATDYGISDLMTICDRDLGFGKGSVEGYAVAFAATLLMAALTARVVHSGDWVLGLSVAFLISLICFKHLQYDYVVLLPAAGLALRSRGWSRWVPAVAIGYFWFGRQLLAGPRGHLPISVQTVGSCILLLLILLVLTHPLGRRAHHTASASEGQRAPRAGALTARP